MILKETEEKKKYNDALREKKKYCLLPGGLPAKVRIIYFVFVKFTFIASNVLILNLEF